MFVNINKLVDHVILFVEVCGLSNLMYVKFSQPLQTHSFGAVSYTHLTLPTKRIV